MAVCATAKNRHYGPVYINVKGREPQSVVEPGAEYERVRKHIIGAARAFTHPLTGRKIVGRVLGREDVYHGPHLGHAPDLILIPADSRDFFFGLADFGSNRVVDTVYRYSGMHRDDGMLMMAGPHVAARAPVEGTSIVDVAPTILHATGLPVPNDMDGKPLLALFDEEVRERMPQYVDVEDGENGQRSHVLYSEDEKRQIQDRLRGLGYLG